PNSPFKINEIITSTFMLKFVLEYAD
ncbi:hypothetical protein MNBD_NITROSPINAE01-1404, partial [hydrothermal vent metagenome]